MSVVVVLISMVAALNFLTSGVSNFLIGTSIKWSPKGFFLQCALLVIEKVDAEGDWVAGADEELHEVGADVKAGGILDRGSEAPAGHHLVGMILGSAAPAGHQRSETEVRQCLVAGRKPRDIECVQCLVVVCVHCHGRALARA